MLFHYQTGRCCISICSLINLMITRHILHLVSIYLTPLQTLYFSYHAHYRLILEDASVVNDIHMSSISGTYHRVINIHVLGDMNISFHITLFIHALQGEVSLHTQIAPADTVWYSLTLSIRENSVIYFKVIGTPCLSSSIPQLCAFSDDANTWTILVDSFYKMSVFNILYLCISGGKTPYLL